ncbi:MAG TPA: DUF3168 domain-containing protein [Crocinitomix sp.]|nr:DUF3168 domain-containing protein [Crocinitomix sp.]
MIQLSNLIYKGLSEDTEVSNLVGTKVFPLIADQKTKLPFIVYRVSLLNSVTKDKAERFSVEILSFETSYNKSLALNEKAVNAIDNVDLAGINYKFIKGSAEPLIDTDNRFYVKQIINIKK